jgi:hypothetical protein
MNTPLYLYEVSIARQDRKNPARSKITAEYYAASHIRDVWAALESELLDERASVETIKKHVPILRVLTAETP